MIVASFEHSVRFGVEKILEIAGGLGGIAGAEQFRDFCQGFAGGYGIVNVDGRDVLGACGVCGLEEGDKEPENACAGDAVKLWKRGWK